MIVRDRYDVGNMTLWDPPEGGYVGITVQICENKSSLTSGDVDYTQV